MKKSAVILVFFFATLIIYINNINSIDEDYTLTDQDIATIKCYINQNLNLITHNDGVNHTVIEIFGSDFRKGEIYLWALSEEIYDEGTQKGAGSSVPMLIKVKQGENGLQVVEHTLPESGTLYNRDIKRMFPVGVRKKINAFNSEKLIIELTE